MSSTDDVCFLHIIAVRLRANGYFYHFSLFVHGRKSIFLKSKRSSTVEQTFSSKTDVQHLLNTRFYDLSSVAKVQRHVVYLRNNKPCPLAMRWHAPFSCPKYH